MTDLLKSRARKPLSTLLAIAMVFSIVVVPAFAADPATAGATITSGGTNLDSFGEVTTASNGYNGTHSIEVTGVVATQSVLKGTTAGNTATLNDLDVTHVDDFKIAFGGVETTITGLTLSSTVADVMTKITSQITSLTAGRDSISRLTLTAKPYGPLVIQALGDATGIAAKVFGPLGGVNPPAAGWGWRFDLGLDYGVYGAALPDGFQIIDTFTDAVSGSKMVLPAPQIGSLDPITGVFRNNVRSADNLWTAIKLADGYDLILSTSGGKGLAVGTATVTVSGGVRDAVAPTFTVSQDPAAAQAGTVATITASLVASNTAAGALDGATFTLPEGFVATGTPTATIGSAATSVTVAGGVYTVTGGAGKLVAGAGQAITLTARVVVSTKAGDYKLKATYKNFGGSATPELSASGLKVIAEDKVKTVQFVDSPVYARAGQTAVIGAHLLDQYGNELDPVLQPRNVQYSVTSTLSAGQSGNAAIDPFYGYKSAITVAKTAGVSTVKYSVFKVAGTVEASGSVNVDSTNVGAPAKLMVVSTKNPADAGTSVFFRVQLIDANGKTTAFLANEAEDPTAITLNYGPKAGVFLTAAVAIPAKFSEAIVSLTSDKNDTAWDMWAFDNVGRVAKSETIVQLWAAGVDETKYSKLTVVATPHLLGAGNENWGYAAADGVSAVTFTVKTNIATAGRKILAAPSSATEAAFAGVLVNTSAITNASGEATFTVISTTPSLIGAHTNVGRFFKEFKFTDANDAAIVAGLGYAHFYTPEVRAVSVDKSVAFADGKDAATFSFTVKNPLDGTVVAGTRIYFTTTDSESVLSTTSAVTDANGVATVALTSKKASTTQVGVIARDFSGFSVLNSLTKGVGVYFTDYIASVKDGAALTAQQSERGAEVSFNIVLKDSTGALVTFDEITSVTSPSDTVDEVMQDEDDTSLVTVELDPKKMTTKLVPVVAGDTVKFVLQGTAKVEGPFTSVDNKVFFGDFSVAIVNKAVATGRGSIVLERANISGTGFKPGTMVVKAIKGTKTYTLGLVVANEDGVVKTQPVDLENFPVGKYDLIVDGIKFTKALTVVPGFDIGLTKTLIRVWSSPAKPVRGKRAVFYGQISDLGFDGLAHGGLARPLYLRYRARSTGRWTTIAVRVSTDTGAYSFATIAKRGQYCVWSPGDGQFLANSSLAYGAKAITVK